MSTTYINPLYTETLPLWQRVRDCYAGQAAIKDRTTDYLPEFCPPNPERYVQYINRATFIGVTAATTDKLTGAAFRKAPVYEVPSEIEFMISDMDGAGASAEQVSRSLVHNVTLLGRHGVMMDYTANDVENPSTEQVQTMGLRPFSREYPAESIVDWDDDNGRLTFVKLKEEKQVRSKDRQTVETETWYRELYIGDDGFYHQQMWRENERQGEEITPTFGNNKFTEIPFIIVGRTDNHPDVDKVTMLDIANLNITHYQVSADWMENLRQHGQLTLGMSTDFSIAQFKEANPNGVSIGAMSGINLGKGGAFHTASAPESSSLDKARGDLLADMTAIGASLVDPSLGNQSATAANINASSQVSVMESIVGNCSDAMERLLRWGFMFTTGREPVDGSISYAISKEFFKTPIDPQTLAQIGVLYQQRVIPAAVMAKVLTDAINMDITEDDLDEAAIEPR